MNILLRLKRNGTVVISVLAAGLTQALSAQSPTFAFSEPEVVFYGQIRANDTPGDGTILTSGTMEWTLTPPVGDAIVVITELAAYPNGMSYVLKIPAEALLAGTTLSPNTLPTGPTSVTYDRSSITVGGTPYLISVQSGDDEDSLVYSSSERGLIERIDLALTVGLADFDGDGMSDDFENRYADDGLNPNADGDANGDIDGDGVTNLGEFLAGTDPNGFDYDTWAALASTALSPAERARAFDKDNDGLSNLLEFAIGAQPSLSDRSFSYGVIQLSVVTVGPDEHFTLTFTKPGARRLGVSYAIEQSDLSSGTWTQVVDGSLILLQDTSATLQAREANPMSLKGFLRLRIDDEG